MSPLVSMHVHRHTCPCTHMWYTVQTTSTGTHTHKQWNRPPSQPHSICKIWLMNQWSKWYVRAKYSIIFLDEGKTGNYDYLGIDFNVLRITSSKRKGENISCPLPKLKSTIKYISRTYQASEKMTHNVVENICKSHAQ